MCIRDGLSGSGKSTIAIALEQRLHTEGRYAVVLDGDNVRAGINNNLGFSDADRSENIRRVAEVAKLFAQNGAVVICCFVSPTVAIREQARSIIGEADFSEIFVDTPLEECAVSYTHLRAHETVLDLVCRLLLENKKNTKKKTKKTQKKQKQNDSVGYYNTESY